MGISETGRGMFAVRYFFAWAALSLAPSAFATGCSDSNSTCARYTLNASEKKHSWHLGEINLVSGDRYAWHPVKGSEYWNQGKYYAGSGVRIAVIDDGFGDGPGEARFDYPDLRGQSVVSGLYWDPFARTMAGGIRKSMSGHGTAVASVIVAGVNPANSSRSKRQPDIAGVAPGATLVPYRLPFSANGAAPREFPIALAETLRRATEPIVNLSLAYGDPSSSREDQAQAVNRIEQGLRVAMSRDQLVVVAAGNGVSVDGMGLVSVFRWPALFASAEWAQGRILVVGNYDPQTFMPDGVYARDENGVDLNKYYLMAPGMGINTYGSGGEVGPWSGTSFSAPQVAGVAALVKSKWPHLKAGQIAFRLTRTARSQGDPWIYGWGMLDAWEALNQPIGRTRTQTASGRQYAPGTAALTLPGAFGSALGKQPLSTLYIDESGADFSWDATKAIRPQAAPVLTVRQSDPARTALRMERTLPSGGRYVADINQQTDLHQIEASPRFADGSRDVQVNRLGGFSLVVQTKGEREWAMGGNGFGAYFFGSATALADTRARVPDAANPMFSLVPGHSHVGFSMPVANSLKLKAGLLTTTAARSFAEQNGQGLRMPEARISVAEITHLDEAAATTLTVGQLAENNGLLGGRGEGALGLGGRSLTRFMTLDTARRLGERWSGYATATLATTPTHNNGADSLIEGHARLRGTAFALGITRQGAFRWNDRLTLAVSQPLRIQSGQMHFLMPTGFDAEGSLRFARHILSVVPEGRELRKELGYFMPLTAGASVSAFLAHRAQPDHERGRPSEQAVSVRWRQDF